MCVCALIARAPAKLHQRYLYDVLLSTYQQWCCPPPQFEGQSAQAVIDLPEPPEGTRMLIVGDTHGQLADVLWLFAECMSHRQWTYTCNFLCVLLATAVDLFAIPSADGLPSRTNVYLFNGDVADRGLHAVEIFVLLFCFMLKEPGSVFLSRGNHENMEINERAQQVGCP